MDENKSLAYFFLGLGVGVALGVVFAPQSGSETRGLIRGKALEGTDYVRRRGEELRDSASDLVQRGREAVTRQKENLNAAVDAGKQAYREAISQSSAAEPPVPGSQAL